MRKRKTDESKRIPFVPCGHCYGGLIRVPRGSGYTMCDCSCMLAWKSLNSDGHVSVPPPPAAQFWWQRVDA